MRCSNSESRCRSSGVRPARSSMLARQPEAIPAKPQGTAGHCSSIMAANTASARPLR
jgi:hypothetical protein